jgi:hypothetical protein
MSNRLSILSNLGERRLTLEPFPHIVIENALDRGVYDALMAVFPSLDVVCGKTQGITSNTLYMRPARDVVSDDRVSPLFREMFAYHVSNGFWHELTPLLAATMRSLQPDLERRIGKPIEDWRVTTRGSDDNAAEVMLDCQFCVNSPVTRPSSVRTAHIDKAYKFFNALLYCRHPDDDTDGGDLVLYKFKSKPGFSGAGRTAIPRRIEPVASVAYRPNTLVLFLNSPLSVHGVTPRPVTNHIRRYINITGMVRQDLFKVPKLNPITAVLERAFAHV